MFYTLYLTLCNEIYHMFYTLHLRLCNENTTCSTHCTQYNEMKCITSSPQENRHSSHKNCDQDKPKEDRHNDLELLGPMHIETLFMLKPENIHSWGK